MCGLYANSTAPPKTDGKQVRKGEGEEAVVCKTANPSGGTMQIGAHQQHSWQGEGDEQSTALGNFEQGKKNEEAKEGMHT